MTDSTEFKQEQINLKRMHNRRMKIGFFWAVVCVASVWIQPYLKLDIGLVSKLLDKGTWVAGLLIVGISGVNALYAYIQKK